MTGPLPSISAMKKALLTAIAAIAWFLPGHLAIAALLVLIWGSAMASTANTAKTRAVETRLNAQVVAVAPAINLVNNGGTIGGNVTVNGSHTVTGNMGVYGGTTLVGSSSCSSNFTVGGSHTVNGNMGVQGGSLVGSSSCSNDFTTGGNATVTALIPSTAPSAWPPPISSAAPAQRRLTTDSISTERDIHCLRERGSALPPDRARLDQRGQHSLVAARKRARPAQRRNRIVLCRQLLQPIRRADLGAGRLGQRGPNHQCAGKWGIFN